jgi:hypothetical protein
MFSASHSVLTPPQPRVRQQQRSVSSRWAAVALAGVAPHAHDPPIQLFHS